MGPRRLAVAALAIVAAAAAYSVYAPDFVGRLFPSAEPATRRVHDALFAAKPAPSTTPAAGAEASASKPAVVSVAAAKVADYPVFIEGLGQVQAENTVTVRTRVDGQIVKIAFAEGQTVKAGDLLAQVDPRPFRAALDQANAKQAQDQATLVNAQLDLDAIRRSPSRASPPSNSSTLKTLWSTSSSPKKRPTQRRSTRRRSNSTTRRSQRRFPAGSASAWSTRATSSMRRSRPASSRSPRSSQSPPSSQRPRTTCRAYPQRSPPARRRSKRARPTARRCWRLAH